MWALIRWERVPDLYKKIIILAPYSFQLQSCYIQETLTYADSFTVCLKMLFQVIIRTVFFSQFCGFFMKFHNFFIQSHRCLADLTTTPIRQSQSACMTQTGAGWCPCRKLVSQFWRLFWHKCPFTLSVNVVMLLMMLNKTLFSNHYVSLYILSILLSIHG